MKTFFRLLGSFVVPIVVCVLGNFIALLIGSLIGFFSVQLSLWIYFGHCIGIGVVATECARKIAPFGGKIMSGIFAISYCAIVIYAMVHGWNDCDKIDILNMKGIALGSAGAFVAILKRRDRF